MIKVNKKKFIKQLKAALKARKQEEGILLGGLFVPTEHDIKEELVGLPAFSIQKEINHD
jgi:hypothetical protein